MNIFARFCNDICKYREDCNFDPCPVEMFVQFLKSCLDK